MFVFLAHFQKKYKKNFCFIIDSKTFIFLFMTKYNPVDIITTESVI